MYISYTIYLNMIKLKMKIYDDICKNINKNSGDLIKSYNINYPY